MPRPVNSRLARRVARRNQQDFFEEEQQRVRDSFKAAAEVTHASLKHKVGDSERDRHHDINAVIFLKRMQDHDYTFVWEDGPGRGLRHRTVFEALAAAMPEAEEMGLLEKADHVKEYSHILKSGFYAARKWLDKWYNKTVFVVPQANESSLATVVTLDPGFVLECGKNAAQMQAERDIKLASGQVRASTRRLASVTPKEDVRAKLDEIVGHVLRELDHMRPNRLLTAAGGNDDD